MAMVTLRVTGMHCPKCTARVEKVVGALDGVVAVTADFEADTVALDYDGEPETLAAVKSAIAAEDFSVEG